MKWLAPPTEERGDGSGSGDEQAKTKLCRLEIEKVAVAFDAPTRCEVITEPVHCPLLEVPRRAGKPLRDELAGLRSARLGTEWRVVYRIDEAKRIVVVEDIQHRSTVYRRH